MARVIARRREIARVPPGGRMESFRPLLGASLLLMLSLLFVRDGLRRPSFERDGPSNLRLGKVRTGGEGKSGSDTRKRFARSMGCPSMSSMPHQQLAFIASARPRDLRTLADSYRFGSLGGSLIAFLCSLSSSPAINLCLISRLQSFVGEIEHFRGQGGRSYILPRRKSRGASWPRAFEHNIPPLVPDRAQISISSLSFRSRWPVYINSERSLLRGGVGDIAHGAFFANGGRAFKASGGP